MQENHAQNASAKPTHARPSQHAQKKTLLETQIVYLNCTHRKTQELSQDTINQHLIFFVKFSKTNILSLVPSHLFAGIMIRMFPSPCQFLAEDKNIVLVPNRALCVYLTRFTTTDSLKKFVSFSHKMLRLTINKKKCCISYITFI